MYLEDKENKADDKTWFLLRNGRRNGPYTWEEIKQVSQSRGLDPADKLWTETWPNWVAVANIPELRPFVVQPAQQKRTKKKTRWIAFVIGGAAIIVCGVMFFVFSGFFTLLLFGGQAPVTGSLSLGDMQILAVASVGNQGGQIRIEPAGSELKGMLIDVPQDAYPGEITFTVGETPILSHTFGEDFTPASPLITIDNGQVFANQPLLVTIPIQKTDDEFAMGFYYDRETGTLEGIPFVSLSNQEIVLFTAHFSDIVVSKIQIGRIVDEIDTGFTPGVDDLQVKNHGSFIAPEGHCAGQSIAAMYYYNNIKQHGELRVGQQIPLWGRFDNETHITSAQTTPDLMWDDASVIRLSSALQVRTRWGTAWEGVVRIGSPEAAMRMYWWDVAYNDEMTFYAFAYTMQLTQQPQFIYIDQSEKIELKPGQKRGAHAMIAYKIKENQIFIADPNFEGDSSRHIELDRQVGHVPVFKPYNSGLNAEDTSLYFDRVGYFGLSALIDDRVVAHYWREVLSGSVVAQDLFPDDIQIEVAEDRDENGDIIFTDLVDGLVLSTEGHTRVDDQGSVLLRTKDITVLDHVTVYFGDQYERAFQENTLWLNFKQGENDVGIRHERFPSDDARTPRFINFRRFMVTISPADQIIEEQPASEETRQMDDYELEPLFNAGKIAKLSLEKLGFLDPSCSSGVDFTLESEVYCYVYSSTAAFELVIRNREIHYDPGSLEDLEFQFQYNYYYIMPTCSTYRGLEVCYFHAYWGQWVNRYGFYVLNPEWHVILNQRSTYIDEESVEHRKIEPMNFYPIVDVLLETAVELGMIELTD